MSKSVAIVDTTEVDRRRVLVNAFSPLGCELYWFDDNKHLQHRSSLTAAITEVLTPVKVDLLLVHNPEQSDVDSKQLRAEHKLIYSGTGGNGKPGWIWQGIAAVDCLNTNDARELLEWIDDPHGPKPACLMEARAADRAISLLSLCQAVRWVDRKKKLSTPAPGEDSAQCVGQPAWWFAGLKVTGKPDDWITLIKEETIRARLPVSKLQQDFAMTQVETFLKNLEKKPAVSPSVLEVAALAEALQAMLSDQDHFRSPVRHA